MSQHDPYPNEEQEVGGDSSGLDGKQVHHNWFFWVAAFFILIGLIGFMLEGIPDVRSSVAPAQTTTPAGGEK